MLTLEIFFSFGTQQSTPCGQFDHGLRFSVKSANRNDLVRALFLHSLDVTPFNVVEMGEASRPCCLGFAAMRN
jgi:hypothetical protein